MDEQTERYTYRQVDRRTVRQTKADGQTGRHKRQRARQFFMKKVTIIMSQLNKFDEKSEKKKSFEISPNTISILRNKSLQTFSPFCSHPNFVDFQPKSFIFHIQTPLFLVTNGACTIKLYTDVSYGHVFPA